MPLTAGTWNININGVEGEILIGAPTSDGRFMGTFGGTSEFSGLWDEASQRIVFAIRVPPDGAVLAFFKGCLFRTPLNPAPGQDVITTIVGTVQMGQGGSSSPLFPTTVTARRNVFGWMAQIREIALAGHSVDGDAAYGTEAHR